MQSYWQEFIIFAVANTLALISPGPDFLMVVQTSLRYSRKSAILVALGISLGEMVHVIYSVVGLSFIITQNVVVFMTLKYLGAAYLFYIGSFALRSKPQAQKSSTETILTSALTDLTSRQAFMRGVLTNVLNVKAAFFTISFFAVLVSPTTPASVLIGYAAFMLITTFIWFSLVAMILTNTTIQARFLNTKHWIERGCGVMLVALGIKIAFSDL